MSGRQSNFSDNDGGKALRKRVKRTFTNRTLGNTPDVRPRHEVESVGRFRSTHYDENGRKRAK